MENNHFLPLFSPLLSSPSKLPNIALVVGFYYFLSSQLLVWSPITQTHTPFVENQTLTITLRVCLFKDEIGWIENFGEKMGNWNFFWVCLVGWGGRKINGGVQVFSPRAHQKAFSPKWGENWEEEAHEMSSKNTPHVGLHLQHVGFFFFWFFLSLFAFFFFFFFFSFHFTSFLSISQNSNLSTNYKTYLSNFNLTLISTNSKFSLSNFNLS